MSNLSRLLENQKPYDDSIFSDEIDESTGISPRQNMQNILSICEDFILNFDKDDDKNLIFYGNTGLVRHLCLVISLKEFWIKDIL